jgi:hypothetical protein
LGVALSQFLNKMESFGNRDQCIKTYSNLVFKKFGSRVLVIGNNMLTGKICHCQSVKKEVMQL